MICSSMLPILLGLMLVGLAALPVAAQINDPTVKPENIEMLKAEAPVLHYALAGGFLLASLAVGFKPCKRSAEQKK